MYGKKFYNKNLFLQIYSVVRMHRVMQNIIMFSEGKFIYKTRINVL